MTTDTSGSGIREIDIGTPLTGSPAGWHCLGLADTFRDGAPRHRGVRHQARGVRRLARRPAGARRLLPAHGRRPVAGAPSRATRSPARSTTGAGAATAAAPGPVREAHAAAGPHPALAHARTTGSCSSGTTRRAPPPAEVTIPRRSTAADSGRVDRLDVELGPHRRLALPRDRRQRRRHGALLLHPLRLPDVLQERPRGPRRLPVPGVNAPPGRRTTRRSSGSESHLRSDASYFGPSYMIN